MNIQNRRALKQEAAAALGAAPSQKKLIALYAGAAIGLSLLITVLSSLLDKMIGGTSGLASFGNRSLLQTIQVVLILAQFVAVMCWDYGYLGTVLSISRRGRPAQQDLLNGFRRFGPILRLTVLKSLITLMLTFTCVYLSSMVFLFTPFASELMETMVAAMTETTTAAELAADPAVLTAITNASIPLFLLVLAIYLVLVLPITYLFRMAVYCLLDDPRGSALSALGASRRMMRRNRWNLLKLDLSFWWYYLLDSLVLLVLYSEGILGIFGIVLPFDPAVNSILCYIPYCLLYFVLRYHFQNYVEVTYANAYEALRPKPQTDGVVLGNIFQM